MKQFAKSVALEAVRSTWPLVPRSVSRAVLGLLSLGVEEPVEVGEMVSRSGAACCISVDFDATGERRLELNTAGTRLAIEMSMRHNIPMTWAICGKTAEADPHSYETILNCGIPHEVGVHTYSHVDVSMCGEDELVTEVERCISLLGLKERPRTFIFPWNREAHFEVLARLGFTAYRGEKRGIGMPRNERGLWNIRPVCYLSENSYGAASLVKRFIDLCVSTRSIFHLWFHPWSIVVPSPSRYEVEVLEPIFGYIDGMREEGKLDVVTMGELARNLGKRAA